MIQPLDLDAIQARTDAATPGRWLWYGTGRDRNLRLQTHEWDTVMDFVRHGLQGAQPRFNVDGLMETAAELLPDGQNACRGFPHPDAEFIAHARQDVPALIAYARELEQQLTSEKAVSTHLVEKLQAHLDASDEWMGERAQLLAENLRLANTARSAPTECSAPHPVARLDRCERQPGHDGWHATSIGSWPDSTLPFAPSAAHDAR
ncbi:hypothetical protein [Kitasatospora sp. CB01950]|uniref:hypothetical protein n=1 Tax=Kitasatospora sp. CB01950 TaxID=1703930 RepID=UPI00093AC72C|nr:hypothetical protein [Kitasatospora sp. CB01950]